MSKELYLLISNSRKGNKRAQIKLYDQFCNAMFFVALRYLKNDDEAKEAMQDAFLKAFLNLHQFSDKTNFGSWLKKIVIHTCIDKLKKKKLETISIEDQFLEISEADNNWNFDIKITKEQILEAINNLKIKYQLVVKLYLIEGYDHEEIASILKIPINTSKTHLMRGKMALKTVLKSEKYGT